MKAFVVAAPTSGAGKTTIAAGLMRALTRRGWRVQGFKVGPDYIDPTYHTAATGRPARNLDSWLMGRDAWLESFHRAMVGADIAVIEGVMGLFDGRTGAGEAASTAEAAKWLGAPVVLALDAGKAARSLAAIAYGCRHFDPDVPFAGVILNRVASDRHLAAVAAPIEREARLALLGHLRRDPTLALPERYLGLKPLPEDPKLATTIDHAAEAIERGVDLDRLIALADCEPPRPDPTGQLAFPPNGAISPRCRIAVARDQAFTFYYQDNLDLLAAWGAEVVPFSPLTDATLPPATDALYLGGGFPELFGDPLAANSTMLASIRSAVANGTPTWAECGGLMYLLDGIVDQAGQRHALVGALPGWARLDRRRLSLGYRWLRARVRTPITEPGDCLPGHEFHWSTVESEPSAAEAAWEILAPPTNDPPGDDSNYTSSRLAGHGRPNLLASYVHLHLAAKPGLAARLVDAAARWRAEQRVGVGR